ALSLFGSLKISQLKSMPKNRLPIATKLCSESERKIAYQKISSEIAAGRQVFIITPKVEESESETKSVKAEFERLKKLFPNFRIGLIYGGLKSTEKEQVMNDFAAKQFDILVATTVIEIGIDIPNASVMLIEGSENFGLAQLHQLRGRVGRGEHPSYCYLFTTNDNHTESERLKVFEKISDGFILAEHDLEQRGFGDLFGENQSGFNFKFPKFITIEALKTAHQIVKEILNTDQYLTKHQAVKSLSDNYLETIHTE
ncbi:MAG TPA: helicase-related protein, partial [Candidatus Doudnabacteria bacterium]|nr:helicase-related protein [Candidatus Doudnabacteria bacterium]